MARGNGPALFAEDSENESVNTTTTENSSESDREYDVEKVLAEQFHIESGRPLYLIKWEGYPLHDCTWEPREHIIHDVVLQEWEKTKHDANQGKTTLFNLEEYNMACEEHLEKLESKQRRRAVKQRKRAGLHVPEEEDSDSQFELPTTETPKRTRVKPSPVKRKGVAKPISTSGPKRPKVAVKDGGASAGVANEDSDANSLFGEQREPATTSAPTKQKSANPVISTPELQGTLNQRPAASSTSRKSTDQQPSSVKKPGPTSSNDQQKAAASITKDPASSVYAPKSAPSAGSNPAPTAKRSSTINIFSGHGTKTMQRKQRARVSGETPKDSTDPKFTRLSVQNRYQNYSRNEPAPDMNALAIVDPKTGQVQPPKAAVAKIGLASAYGRRSPPPAPRPRSPSEAPRQPPRPGEAQVRHELPSKLAATESEVRQLNTCVPPSGGDYRKSRTCRDWRLGTCKFTADTCVWAHWATERERLKELLTCHFWYYGGKCSKSAEQCDFAHEYTGAIAGPPGSFKSRSLGPHAPPSIQVSDPRLIQQNSFAADSRVWPSYEPLMLAQTQVTPYKPAEPLKHTAGEEMPTTTQDEEVADPRLRRRVSFAVSTEKGQPREPQLQNVPVAGLGDDAESAIMDDNMPMAHGSLKMDLEMAKAGIKSELLDASRLLVIANNKKEIVNVFIHMPDRPDELALLSKYLKGLKRNVYTSKDTGVWSFFRKQYSSSCLVVLHPSELFTGSLPGLHNLLTEGGSSARVFSIGVQHEQCIREGREPAYEAQRLFPHGGIFFITDDVFVYYPQKATEIIELFLEQTKNKPPGAETSKIGARPGVKDWLYQLVSKKIDEQVGYGNFSAAEWVDCYDAVCRLCQPDDEDPDFPDHYVPLESSHLWSAWEGSLPSFQGRWESGDEEGATDYMANFFAGEACLKAWKYRKFYFIYQRPQGEQVGMNSQGIQEAEQTYDPKSWAKKYCHIGVVTPDHVLQVMRKKR